MFLFFDLDDTLYDQYLPFEAAYLEIFGDTPREKMNDIFVKSRRLAGQAYAMVDRGELAPGEVYCYRLIRAFETYGVKLPHAIAHTFRDAYDKTQSRIALSDGMKAFLGYLCDVGVRFGCMSNGPGPHQRHKVEVLGLSDYFEPEAIIISGEVGHAKPVVDIYRVAEERFGAAPSDCMMIGDAYDIDIRGALRAGWQTLWIDRRGETNPAERDFHPHYTARSEEEMIATLQHLLREKA